jgi:hypothetical protein
MISFIIFSFFLSGVVHLASTESTGGSTTGDDEESSDAAVQSTAVDKVLLETRRNTYQNESIANSYRQVMIQFIKF